MTVVEGVQGKGKELNKLAKELKAHCACGGTAKDERILLQGDHRSRVKEFLVSMGYAARNIEVA